jgi:HEAT repeat protein
MPFVKREPATTQPPSGRAPDVAALIEALHSPDVDTRWNAARSIGVGTELVPALAAALDAEQVPRVREAIMTALIRVGNDDAIAAVLPDLRSADAARRAAAIELLQALPDAVAPFVTALFGDADADVRILAVEVVREMPAREATRLLCDLLADEPHPNVCAAAIDVLAEVGTREALPVLEACGRRFASVPFLPFAVATAIARISGAEG